MALEDIESAGKYIDDLVSSNPAGTDILDAADNHLRGIKNVLKLSFPNITGPMTATQAELNKLAGLATSAAELGFITGLTSAVQTQLNARVNQTNPILDGTITGTAFLDEDTMSSNSAIAVASQQSIKAYVDGLSASNVLQIVNTSDGARAALSTIIPSDDTIPQITEGVEVMTRTITPGNTAHILKIEVVCYGSPDTSDTAAYWIVALFQDATAAALACGAKYAGGALGQGMSCVTFTHYMTAGTVSEITFRVRAGQDLAGTADFNGYSGARLFGGVLASSITITEYKA